MSEQTPGESYVDFGLPLMFFPIFIFGFAFGSACRFINTRLRYDELRTGVIIVITWSTMGVYESSWLMLIGPTITILGLLGGGAFFLDRVLTASEKRSARVTSRKVEAPAVYRGRA